MPQCLTFQLGEEENHCKFSEIVSLHSELVAVSKEGYLHHWYWSDPLPPSVKPRVHGHHRAQEMNITNDETVMKIAACNIRVSVVMESGKVSLPALHPYCAGVLSLHWICVS